MCNSCSVKKNPDIYNIDRHVYCIIFTKTYLQKHMPLYITIHLGKKTNRKKLQKQGHVGKIQWKSGHYLVTGKTFKKKE